MAAYRIAIVKDKHGRKWYRPECKKWYWPLWATLTGPRIDSPSSKTMLFAKSAEALKWVQAYMRTHHRDVIRDADKIYVGFVDVDH